LACLISVHDPVGFLQQGKFRVGISGLRMVVSDDVLHNLDLLGREADGMKQVSRNRGAVFLLGPAVVVPVSLLCHLDSYVMQQRRGDHDIAVTSRIVVQQTVGMAQDAQGVLDSTVITAEVFEQNPRQSGT
jgi:hypothetical protein